MILCNEKDIIECYPEAQGGEDVKKDYQVHYLRPFISEVLFADSDIQPAANNNALMA